MAYQTHIQAIKQGKLAPIYTLLGQDIYLQDRLVETLKEYLDQEGDMDYSRFDLQETPLNDIIDEANSFSFFADQRLILVDHAEALLGQSRPGLTKNQEAALLEYCQNPNPASVIVFKTQRDQLDKRRKLVKTLQKTTAMVDCSSLSERELETYLAQYLDQESFDLDRNARQELLLRTNFNLTSMMSELRKIATFAQVGQVISKQDIILLVPRSLESDIFELTKAVLSLDVARATQIYQDLLLMKKEPVALHALIMGQFRLYIQTRILSLKGSLQGDIAKQLGVHPYRVKLALENNRALSLDQLYYFYLLLVDGDKDMKTGVGQPESHFYILLMKLVDLVNL